MADGVIGADPQRLGQQYFDGYTARLNKTGDALAAAATANPLNSGDSRIDIDLSAKQLPKLDKAVELIRALAAVPQGYQSTVNRVGELLEAVENANTETSVNATGTGRHG